MGNKKIYTDDHIRNITHKYLRASTARLPEKLLLKYSDKFKYQGVKKFHKNDMCSGQSR